MFKFAALNIVDNDINTITNIIKDVLLYSTNDLLVQKEKEEKAFGDRRDH